MRTDQTDLVITNRIESTSPPTLFPDPLPAVAKLPFPCLVTFLNHILFGSSFFHHSSAKKFRIIRSFLSVLVGLTYATPDLHIVGWITQNFLTWER